MGKIRIAIAGVGNCASSLLQGIEYYRNAEINQAENNLGLMHYRVGSYSPADIEVVAAFDVDRRKVGQTINKAIFSMPNNTKNIWTDFADPGPVVQMGPILDGVPDHMADYPDDQVFVVAAEKPPVDVPGVLRETQADILLNYLPVGSQRATEFYAEAALEAQVGFINCVPVFIASDTSWSDRFREHAVSKMVVWVGLNGPLPRRIATYNHAGRLLSLKVYANLVLNPDRAEGSFACEIPDGAKCVEVAGQ